MISFSTFLEKRKRHSLQPSIKEAEDIYLNIPPEERFRYFVTLTKLNKVGINPKSVYNTPNGVYMYTLEYFIDNSGSVPFPSKDDYNYINIIKYTGPEDNVLHLGGSRKKFGADAKIDRLIDKLENYVPEEDGEKMYADAKSKSAKNYSDTNTIYYYVWSLLGRYTKNPNKWASEIRKAGLHCVIDHGTGTIHPYEPEQAVCVFPRELKIIKTLIPRGDPFYSRPEVRFRSLGELKAAYISYLDKEIYKKIKDVDIIIIYNGGNVKKINPDKFPNLKFWCDHVDLSEIEDLLKTPEASFKFNKNIISVSNMPDGPNYLYKGTNNKDSDKKQISYSLGFTITLNLTKSKRYKGGVMKNFYFEIDEKYNDVFKSNGYAYWNTYSGAGKRIKYSTIKKSGQKTKLFVEPLVKVKWNTIINNPYYIYEYILDKHIGTKYMLFDPSLTYD